MTYADHKSYEREQLRRRSSMKEIQNSNNYGVTFGIIILSLGVMASIAFFAAAIQMTTAFTTLTQYHHSRPHHVVRDSSTRIFLEDWVADMIDGELDRLNHHKKYDEKSMEQLKGAVLSKIDVGAAGYPSMMMDEDERESFAEHNRDERMAFTKPEKYCADRCVATGNCDILEDFYELTPENVIKFCEECVLNFDDDEDEDSAGCDIPDAFYEKEYPIRP